jgi:hypothetical protein
MDSLQGGKTPYICLQKDLVLVQLCLHRKQHTVDESIKLGREIKAFGVPFLPDPLGKFSKEKRQKLRAFTSSE